MGEVTMFPGVNRALRARDPGARFAGAVEVLDDNRYAAKVTLEELIWMQGRQERGAKLSKRQPGAPTASIDEQGLRLEWKSGRGYGRQQLCVRLSYGELSRLKEVIEQVIGIKSWAQDLKFRGVEPVWD